MIKNNKDTKIQTESQRMIESNKPWYKKKNTIIASSSILGAGVLATAIAVPLTLIDNTTDTSTTPIAPSQQVKETITFIKCTRK